MYHLAINRVQSGPFSEDDVRARITRGEVGPGDLCWREGWSQWRKVGETFAMGAPELPPVIGSTPIPSAPVAPQSAVRPALGAVVAPAKSSGLALASLLCGIGVFLLFPLLFLFAPLAVIFGHIAKSKIKGSAGTVGGDGMATAGLVMGYLGIAGVPLVGLLAAMAIPAFQKVRHNSQEATVRNNLAQVWSAVEQQMLETQVETVTYEEVVGTYFQDFKPVAGEDYRGLTIRRGDERLSVTLADGRDVTYWFSEPAGGGAVDMTAPVEVPAEIEEAVAPEPAAE